MRAHEAAVDHLLLLADARDVFVGVRGEVAAQDFVVAASEGACELLGRDAEVLFGERALPGEPVILARVYQRAVHVPEHRALRLSCVHRVRV